MRQHGLAYIIILSFINLFSSFLAIIIRQIYKNKSFNFEGKVLPYFFHSYNNTWSNERAIEIPCIRHLLSQRPTVNVRTLEVGNVLSNYQKVNHHILDKYDKSDKVIQSDIIDYSPDEKYDNIILISTLEHVGWDEIPKQPEKLHDALAKLKNLLAKNGKLIITFPIGYNSYLDSCYQEGKLHFSKQYQFKRVGLFKWQPAQMKEVENAKLDKPYRFTNAVVIGIWENNQ